MGKIFCDNCFTCTICKTPSITLAPLKWPLRIPSGYSLLESESPSHLSESVHHPPPRRMKLQVRLIVETFCLSEPSAARSPDPRLRMQAARYSSGHSGHAGHARPDP